MILHAYYKLEYNMKHYDTTRRLQTLHLEETLSKGAFEFHTEVLHLTLRSKSLI